jgi:hypothetical protein
MNSVLGSNWQWRFMKLIKALHQFWTGHEFNRSGHAVGLGQITSQWMHLGSREALGGSLPPMQLGCIRSGQSQCTHLNDDHQALIHCRHVIVVYRLHHNIIRLADLETTIHSG